MHCGSLNKYFLPGLHSQLSAAVTRHLFYSTKTLRQWAGDSLFLSPVLHCVLCGRTYLAQSLPAVPLIFLKRNVIPKHLLVQDAI